MNSEINKLLIVCLDNLGDTVMATATLKPLATIFPAAKLSMWVKRYAAGMLSRHPTLHNVHAADPFWDKSPGQPKGARKDFLNTLSEIKSDRYDAALLLNTEWRRSLACVWTRIPSRVGYKRRHSSLFLTERVSVEPRPAHFIDQHKKLIEAWTGKQLSQEMFIPFLQATAKDLGEAALWFSQRNFTPANVVVLHPFTGDVRKCWPLPSWFKLAGQIKAIKPDVHFVMIGGKNDESDLEPYRAELAHYNIQLLLGASLDLTKGLLAKSMIFVGGDSGPGHMAAALQLPVISLFGKSNAPPERCAPRGAGIIRLIQADSLPDLPAETVFSEVSSLLL